MFILGFLYLQNAKEDPINWFPSYVSTHKMPYGTYILRKEIQNLFPQVEISDIKSPPYMHLQDSTVHGTYFFIDANINFGDSEFHRLMQFVERGNDVLISTHGVHIDIIFHCRNIVILKRMYFLSLRTRRLKERSFPLIESFRISFSQKSIP